MCTTKRQNIQLRKVKLKVSIINFCHNFIDTTRMRGGRLGLRRTLATYGNHKSKYILLSSVRHYFNLIKRFL